jgi:hypothetical protein
VVNGRLIRRRPDGRASVVQGGMAILDNKFEASNTARV